MLTGIPATTNLLDNALRRRAGVAVLSTPKGGGEEVEERERVRAERIWGWRGEITPPDQGHTSNAASRASRA